MEIRRDVSLGTGLIASVCVLLAFGIIGLFSRMTPAVEAILKDNVGSQSAAFDILEALARRAAGGTLDSTRLADAISRARSNLTIEGEAELVSALEAAYPGSLTGDADALLRLATNARALWDLNMDAMRAADASAVRLGAAGAWTAVFGGILVIIIALLSWARLKQRVVEPLEDIARVLHGVRGQQPQLRCLRSGGAPDLDRLRGYLNDLLDDMKRLETGRFETGRAAIRASLVTTLDHVPLPAAIIHHDGRVVAGNPRGLEIFGTRSGAEARQEFATRALAARADEPFAVRCDGARRDVGVHPIPGHDAALCLVSPTVAPDHVEGSTPTSAHTHQPDQVDQDADAARSDA
jgi:hypothetical protein